jgi:hypothetical protein
VECIVTKFKDVVISSADGSTVSIADDTSELLTLDVWWMTLVEKGLSAPAPLVTYTITGSVTVTTGSDPDVGGCSDVDFVCVPFADWVALEIGITDVDVEGLLLLAPPRGSIAPTARLLLVGTIGTLAGCMVVEVEIGGVVVVALRLLTPPISAADEDWAELGIAKESREDVEPGI